MLPDPEQKYYSQAGSRRILVQSRRQLEAALVIQKSLALAIVLKASSENRIAGEIWRWLKLATAEL
jgi:hypothetical protein